MQGLNVVPEVKADIEFLINTYLRVPSYSSLEPWKSLNSLLLALDQAWMRKWEGKVERRIGKNREKKSNEIYGRCMFITSVKTSILRSMQKSHSQNFSN